MLKILIPLSFMLIIAKNNKFNWSHIMASMMILSCTMMKTLGLNYYALTSWLSSDAISTTLIILSFWISSMMMMASMKIKVLSNKPTLFKFSVISLLVILILAFSSSNLFMFYIWFEASLIPTMYLIMTWGYQPERLTASLYLLLYTVVASLPLLSSIFIIYNMTSSLMMSTIMTLKTPLMVSNFPLWMMLNTAFMVKLPLFLTHLWLPKAHVEAPISGSMILAAVLLKLGGYGLIRMSKMFFTMNKNFSNTFIVVSLIGAVITSFICLRQTDMKSLIAYSSVGHMGLLIAGVLSYSKTGVQGAAAMMIAHGFTSSALFIMANITYEKFNTRSLFFTKGLLYLAPMLTSWWFIFTVCNMAAPPSSNLMSEILLMMSATSTSLSMMPLLMIISFTTATYSWILYSLINHGKPSQNFNPLSEISSKNMLLLSMHMIPSFIMLKPLIILG